MALGNEVVLRNDPEEEPEKEPEEEAEEEEEEEADLVDPMDDLRKECESKSTAVALAQKLESCNERVSGRTNTEESCHEEMIDWVHAVDHCIAHSLFSKLK